MSLELDSPIDTIAQDLIKNMSKPRTDYKKNQRVISDSYGRPFDPAIHINKKGKPVLTSLGFCRCKKNKAVPISQLCDVSDLDLDKDKESKPDPDLLEDHKKEIDGSGNSNNNHESNQLGSASAEIIFTISMALGGQEWIPTPQERLYMSSAFTRYYQAKGLSDLPPGFILAAAMLSYFFPRLQKPITKGKIRKFFSYIKEKFAKKIAEKKMSMKGS